MGHQCCTKQKVKRGLWSPEEDGKLIRHITTYGHGSWSSVPKLSGLQRCGKSCRLRWINYLRPDLKRGSFSEQEETTIIDVHRMLGNRWAQIAKHLPGRTDNEVKNFWNSCIKKKLMARGLDPNTHNLLPPPHHHINIKLNNHPSKFSLTHKKPSFVFSFKDPPLDIKNSGFSLPSINAPSSTIPSFEYQNPNIMCPIQDQQPAAFAEPDNSCSPLNVSAFCMLEDIWACGYEASGSAGHEEMQYSSSRQQIMEHRDKVKVCEMEIEPTNELRGGLQNMVPSVDDTNFDFDIVESTLASLWNIL